MSNQWVRLWLDMPNDPKWRTISRVSKQPISAVIAVFVHMMACAANASERGRTQGWNDEDVASALDLETEQVIAIREAMQGRVLEGDHLTGWEKRQPLREDGAAERAKAWREAQKAAKSGNSNDPEQGGGESERKRTQANANEPPDTDTDKSNTPPKAPPQSGKRERKAKTVAPDRFDLPAELVEWATGAGMPESRVAPETEKFLDYHRREGKSCADWTAAWRNWIRKAVEFSRPVEPPKRPWRENLPPGRYV